MAAREVRVQPDHNGARPLVTAMAQIPSIRGPIEAAQKNAAAARAAARAAAWDAAWGAARDAAWGAANAKLAPTKAELQKSAIALLERMCALREDALAA